jgi:uncharacterized protein (TIGR00369 family)
VEERGTHYTHSVAARSRVPAKTVRDSEVTLHQLMLPEHANLLGNVHGGVIVKLADEAAAICAMRHAQRPCVTVAIDSVAFHSPVHVGELLALQASLSYVGRTSMEVRVHVHAENPILGLVTHTNSAHFVFVALDEKGKPTRVPPLELQSDLERDHWREAEERQAHRMALARRRITPRGSAASDSAASDSVASGSAAQRKVKPRGLAARRKSAATSGSAGRRS